MFVIGKTQKISPSKICWP